MIILIPRGDKAHILCYEATSSFISMCDKRISKKFVETLGADDIFNGVCKDCASLYKLVFGNKRTNAVSYVTSSPSHVRFSYLKNRSWFPLMKYQMKTRLKYRAR